MGDEHPAYAPDEAQPGLPFEVRKKPSETPFFSRPAPHFESSCDTAVRNGDKKFEQSSRDARKPIVAFPVQ